MKARPIDNKPNEHKEIDTLLVAYDSKNMNLIIGRKDYRQAVDIINAFQGDEATELYQRLKTQKKEGEKKDE